MKQILILFAVISFLGLTACTTQNQTVTAEENSSPKFSERKIAKNKTPVLVELFTSEGCSSCPPADRLLGKLQNEQPVENAEIITLAFHVDYWNYLGWKDEFASEQFSRRQNDYSTILNLPSNYTPQMIVDGRAEFVGSRGATAEKTIEQATGNKKAEVELFFEKESANLKIKIEEITVSEDSDVWLAMAEDNLETSVKSGENSGRNLKHFSVVRKFQKIGNVVLENKKFETETKINFQTVWKKEDLKLIVFVQGKKTKKVFGLGQTRLK